jgi:DNA-binding MarR family transcriptional regulator
VDVRVLNNYVGYALRRAQSAVFADFIDTLAELKLRPGQFTVLTVIDQNPGTSQSHVSVALGIQKANFVATITDLVQRGYVVRHRSAMDARSYQLELTGRGRRLLERAAALQAVHEARIARRLGEQGREQLLELLVRLAEPA